MKTIIAQSALFEMDMVGSKDAGRFNYVHE